MSEILYESTRGGQRGVTASQAILQGLAPDGGLYVPQSMPTLPDGFFEEMKDKPYQDIAYAILRLFLSDYTDEELRECVDLAYDSKFDTKEIVPVEKVGGNTYYLELFHGATIAFKDMALSILPHLLTRAAKKNQVEEDVVILTATSGDTGKAAMAGFAGVPGTRIIVFYPKGGVSLVQERQMITQVGDNTAVVAIHGNFDNAQTGVKQMFEDKDLAARLKEAGFVVSSANSINVGRLVPQVAYYVYGYTRLVGRGVLQAGEPMDVVVPTGNFGNILAAHYAKMIGTPIDKLVCASNKNKVLYDFFQSGTYDKNREFYLTSSPSMDILISSNLERLIYEITGKDPKRTAELMRQLVTGGRYEITDEERKCLADFESGFATEEEALGMIAEVFASEQYLMDTHTSVAAFVSREYERRREQDCPILLASTASPFKFAKSVMGAIDESYKTMDDFKLLDEMVKLTGKERPAAMKDIENAPILHNRECDVTGMEQTVCEILGL